MKKIITFFLLLLSGSSLLAQRDPIVVHKGGAVGDRSNPLFFDMPAVFYDHDEKTQEIIIDGLGFVNYYDVEIATAASYVTVLTTQVNGSYDTIDISSLPQGHYIITIESPLGNTFEGYFDTNSKPKSPI